MRVYRDEVADDCQVGCVGGEQWNAVDVGGRGDHEVDGSSSWLPAALGDRGGESAPLACHRRVDWECVERGLDHTEALSAPCALVRIRRDERAEMQLGERRNADRRLDVGGGPGADQDRGVEQDPGHANGSTSDAGNRSRSSANVRGTGVSNTVASADPLTQDRRAAGPSSATGLPATVIVNRSPASARRRTSPTLLRSSF